MEDNKIRRCEFVRTLDGDTFEVYLDAVPGMKPPVFPKPHIRVADWYAKELNVSEGIVMRDQFDRLLRAAKRISVHLRYMSFTRIVCDVYLDGILFSGLLTEQLLLLRKYGRTKHPGARKVR